MPMTATSPQTLTTPNAVIGQASYYDILGFGFDQPPNAALTLSVRWAAASAPPAPGTNPVWLVERVTVITGTLLQTAMNAPVTAGHTRYQEIKLALYALLQQMGVMPNGTIS